MTGQNRVRHLVAPMCLGALALSGCAERRLVAAPASPPSATTWTVVWAAGIAAALVSGVLLTLPAWRIRSGARVAVMLLTVQTGAVAITGTVLGAVAVRSWQLIDGPVDASTPRPRSSASAGSTATPRSSPSWCSSSRVGMVLTATIPRWRLGSRPAPTRSSAGSPARCSRCELGAAGYAAIRLVIGAHGWAYVGGTLALPLIGLALATCWPASGSVAAS